MIKAIIYDADGMVIVPPKMFSEYFAEFQHISPDIVIPFFTGEFKACLRGNADLKFTIEPYLTKWQWTKSVDDLLDLWFTYENVVNQPLLDSIIELQKKNILCVLATNQDKYRYQYMIDHMHFDRFFDAIYCSCNLGSLKPEPAFFDAVFADLHGKGITSKSEIMFWDDREAYVVAAESYGFTTHLYHALENYHAVVSAIK